MGKPLRYTTFRDGELEATLHKLDPKGLYFGQTGGSETPQTMGRSRSGLITSHCCTVTYPDGTTGTCRYTRGGPAWHLFRFEHTGREGHATSLPVQYATERIGNTVAIIAENACRLAAAAFSEAVKRERREHFQRAVPPLHHKAVEGEHPQMKVKEAKEASGRYALCLRVGRSTLPTRNTWETLDEAIVAWREGGNTSLVIGCCCRWKRRWEEPRFNPLHADPLYSLPLPCPEQKSVQGAAIQAAHHEEIALDGQEEPVYCGDAADPAVEEEIPLPGDADAPPEAPDTSPDPLWTGHQEGDEIP